MRVPKGFGKRGYWSLAAIEAYISLIKIFALTCSISTLVSVPLQLRINAPPAL